MNTSRAVIVAMTLAICLAMPMLASACRSERQPVRVQLGETFALAIGQSAEVQGRDLGVTFKDVISDSRCPVDVYCVWAGEATVVLEVISGVQREDIEMSMLGGDSVTIELDGYEITAVALTPHRLADQSIERGDYRLEMTIEEIGAGPGP